MKSIAAGSVTLALLLSACASQQQPPAPPPLAVSAGVRRLRAGTFSKRKQLLDVGGGSGAYCIEAVRRYPQFNAMLFDTTPVLEIAKRKIAEAGLSAQIGTVSGDFFTEELPKGSDTILLSMIQAIRNA